MARSALWRFAEAVGGEGTALLVFIVMARLLVPESFGVVALAGVLIGGLQVVVQMGLAEAVVQGREAGHARLSTAFWCGVALGASLMVLVGAASLPLARLFVEPELAPVLAVLASVLPLGGAGMAFQAILVRRMAFKAVALRSLAASGIGGIAGLSFALAGAGVWSLVAQQIVGTSAGLVVLVAAARWRPGLHFDRAEARSLGRFAAPVMGTHLAKYAGKKLDIAILGLFVTAHTVGHYFLATRLIFALGIATYYTIFALALPVLSRLAANGDALRQAAGQTLWLTTAVCLPAGLGVALVADPLLPLIFGEAWRPSVLPLQLLASLSIFYALGLIAGQIMVAAGEPGRFFRLGIANTVLFLALVSLAAPYGPAATAAAGGIANALMLPVYLVMMSRTIGLPIGPVVRGQLPVWGAAALMAALVLSAELWPLRGLAPMPTLLLAIGIGLASYALALWLMAGTTIRRLVASIRVEREASGPPAAT